VLHDYTVRAVTVWAHVEAGSAAGPAHSTSKPSRLSPLGSSSLSPWPILPRSLSLLTILLRHPRGSTDSTNGGGLESLPWPVYIFLYSGLKMLRFDEQFMLEVVSAASWPWFGPISNKGTPLWSGISLDITDRSIYLQLPVISGLH
jgi:hypothetical protein